MVIGSMKSVLARFSADNLGLSTSISPSHPELQDSGFITVHGCDDHPSSNKSIELDKNNGTKLWLLKGVNKNTITVLDEDLDKLLKPKSYCQLFDTNLISSLPSNSALVSFQILNNKTWIKCGHCHNVGRPAGFSKHVCSDFDVYWEGSSKYIQKPNGSFPNCSVLEFPSTDMSHSTHDLLSYLTSQVVIQVRLSHECNNCYTTTWEARVFLTPTISFTANLVKSHTKFDKSSMHHIFCLANFK